MNTLEIAKFIVNVLEDKKGEDILLLDIQNIASFTDYFIFATGTSDRMLDSLVDAVSRQIKEHLPLKPRVEGKAQDGWMLVDAGDVVVHLFSPDQRDYYRLEDLWGKGKIVLRLQ